MVVLSTASPYKFPAAVLAAIGEEGPADEFEKMALLERVTGVAMPENLRGLREKAERHTGVIPKDGMPAFVKGLRFPV